jgi:uncharacterized protein DUF5753
MEAVANLLVGARSVDGELKVTGLRHLQQSYVPLYQRTRTFRSYQPAVVPGFLQTSGYAAALLGSIAATHAVPDDSREAAEARLDRQRVLYERGNEFTFLIEEPVLRCRIGDSGVMTAQLYHLAEVMSLPTVRLGIIPAVARRTVWPLEGFLIFDGSTVQVELLSARVTVTQPREVDLYVRTFAQMQQMAVYGREARDLISVVRSEFA